MTKADAVVVFLALSLLLLLYSRYWIGTNAGETARILIPGEPEIEIPLEQDREYTIKGTLGESKIAVNAGRIRFVNSPCTTKQCVLSGWLQNSGAFAACLPNRISLLVAGKALRFDTINF